MQQITQCCNSGINIKKAPLHQTFRELFTITWSTQFSLSPLQIHILVCARVECCWATIHVLTLGLASTIRLSIYISASRSCWGMVLIIESELEWVFHTIVLTTGECFVHRSGHENGVSGRRGNPSAVQAPLS